LVNKLRPGTIARADPHEDGFRSSANATKFLAAAAGAFGRDDLLRCTPDALFRVARTVVALVARAGEDAAAERVARKVLLGQGGAARREAEKGKDKDKTRTRTRGVLRRATTNSPYGTRGKAASASTPNLSTPAAKKRWSPPGPALPTVRSDSPAEDAVSKSGPVRVWVGAGSRTAGGHDLSASASSGKTATAQAAKPGSPLKSTAARLADESALATDSEDSDAHEARRGRGGAPEEKPPAASASARAPAPVPIRVSSSSEATHTTAQSSLLAASRGGAVGEPGDRASANFNTVRTATTVATSVAPSDLQSLYYRADASSGAPSTSEASHWDELSSGSQHSGYMHSGGALKKPPVLRDRRPSEAAVIGPLARRGGGRGRRGRAPPPAGDPAREGQVADDFVSAFAAPSPPRPIALHRAETERRLSASPPTAAAAAAAAPPRKLAYVGAAAPASASAESLAQLAPRRPLQRPRHSLDAPALLPKEPPALRLAREQSPGAEGGAGGPARRASPNSSSNRHGVYIPRSSSGSPPSPAGRGGGGRAVPPRAVSASGEPEAARGALAASAPAAQPSRLARGRFQSEVDAGTRRRPRPNSYDELGAKPNRSRIESMLDGRERGQEDVDYPGRGEAGTHFFGSVYRALNLNTGQMVAVKRIRLEGLSEDDVKQLMREVDVVKSLSHPSIVKYEGMSRDSDTLNIVLEYAENGSLGQTLKAFGKLNEKLVATYVIKILEGLDYLHRNDVVHCDLKAANILTTKNGNVKLSDFGVSLNLRKVGRDHKSDVTGTPNWMAPEVIELKGASRASDIWSLGCTVIELLTGRPPYADIQNGMSVMYRIVDDPMPPIPDEWSPLLKDFLKLCFQRDPADRPSAEALCEHDWLKEHCEIHRVLRPKDSLPFLRRVSTDLQKADVVRFLGVDVSRSDSRTSDRPRRSEDRSPSPAALGRPGSPPKKRLSTGPTTPKSPDSDASGSIVREHSFVKTSFGKPLLCRVCMQSVKKHAVVCEECTLIAHSRCAPNAPPTCGLRAQLLQYANYSPTPDSPNALDIFKQFTPSSSPVPDSLLASKENTPSPEGETPPPPPTAYKSMFGAFRRSRSSLTPEPAASRQNSQESTNEFEAVPPPAGPSSPTAIPRRPAVLLKPRPRPLSASSDNTTPNRSSLRSALTGGSIDLSDDSYSQSQSHSHAHAHSHSHSQAALQARPPVHAPSRSRSRALSGSGGDAETETEADAGTRYAPSRLSVAVSAADSADPRRASVLAASSVGHASDFGDAAAEQELVGAWPGRRRSRRHEARGSVDRDKEKGCTVQ
ncbi:hypothetical protein DFH11DRAFT_1732067, partial [Phellopilus nigrolimitatus]